MTKPLVYSVADAAELPPGFLEFLDRVVARGAPGIVVAGHLPHPAYVLPRSRLPHGVAEELDAAYQKWIVREANRTVRARSVAAGRVGRDGINPRSGRRSRPPVP